ncbi:MAG: DUF3352 domain-containing protein [Planctomycetes bacterium]|nr:DUF3352 domain-containing protein [Planctomycetota bacterium]
MTANVGFQSLRPTSMAAYSLVATMLLPLAIGGTALCAGSPPSSDLTEVASVLPAGTLAFVAFPNLSGFESQFRSTALYKIFQETQVQKFLEKPLAALRATIKSAAPSGFDDNLIASTFDGAAAFALTSVKLPKPGSGERPDIGLVAIARASKSDKLTAFRSVLKQLAQSEATFKSQQTKMLDVDVDAWTFDEQSPTVFSAQLADRFYVSISPSAMASVLALAKGKGAALSTDATFQKVSVRISTGDAPIMATYVSIEGILALFQPLIPPSVRSALEKSGVSGLKAIGLGTAVKDGVFVDSTFFYCPTPRTGILRCIQSEPLDLSHLAFVPKDLTSFGMRRLNLASVWDSVWETIAAYDPTVADQAKKAIASLEEQLGFAIRADFVESLGTEFIHYSRSAPTGFPELIFLVELKNAQKFTDCLQKLTAKLPNVKIKEVPVGESGKVYYLDLSQLGPMAMFVQPCYGLAGNYLVVSLNLQALKSTLVGFGAKDRPSVRENDGFKALFETVPKGVSSLSYSDTRKSFESLYNSIRGILPMVAASAGHELPFDMALLPTTESISKYLTPGMGYGIVDADGFASRSRTAISTNLFVPQAFVVAGITGVMFSHFDRR